MDSSQEHRAHPVRGMSAGRAMSSFNTNSEVNAKGGHHAEARADLDEGNGATPGALSIKRFVRNLNLQTSSRGGIRLKSDREGDAPAEHFCVE